MTIAVDLGRKATKQTNKQKQRKSAMSDLPPNFYAVSMLDFGRILIETWATKTSVQRYVSDIDVYLTLGLVVWTSDRRQNVTSTFGIEIRNTHQYNVRFGQCYVRF